MSMCFVESLYEPVRPGRKSAGELAEILRLMEQEVQGKVRSLHKEGKRTFHGYFLMHYYDGPEVMLWDYHHRYCYLGRYFKERTIYDKYSSTQHGFHPIGDESELDYFKKMMDVRLRENGFRDIRVYAIELQQYQHKTGFMGDKYVHIGSAKTIAIEISW